MKRKEGGEGRTCRNIEKFEQQQVQTGCLMISFMVTQQNVHNFQNKTSKKVKVFNKLNMIKCGKAEREAQAGMLKRFISSRQPVADDPGWWTVKRWFL